jgi:exopolysaccharide biosynthesis polyprenyl glycosylphosphotransferase
MLFGSSHTVQSSSNGLISTLTLTHEEGQQRSATAIARPRPRVMQMPSVREGTLRTRTGAARRRTEALSLRSRETRNLLIVGTDRVAHDAREYLDSLTDSGYTFRGFVMAAGQPQSETANAKEIVGSVEFLIGLARSMFIDELIFSSAPPPEMVNGLIEEARSHDINLRYIPTVSQTLRNTHTVEYVGDLPTIVLYEKRHRAFPLLVKRSIDVLVATFALMVLSPVFAALALVITLQSSGPVFYASERVGRKGRIFTCYKFRTMVPNADQLRNKLLHLNERSGVLFKMTNDPRVTSVGRVLRKYSLDELPQLWNVLRGEMSLVGPRPCIQSELAQYETSHFRRLDVTPGLTGLWQVEARHDPSFESYIRLDSQYVREWSIWLDLKILLRTFRVVVVGTGV